MKPATQQITVDIDELKAWLEGVLVDFHHGEGIIVNEAECQAAIQALGRGETITCRRGAVLTGTILRPTKDHRYEEVLAGEATDGPTETK